MLPPACPTASSLSKVAARQQTAAPVAACFGRNTGLRHCQCLAALPRRAGGSQPQSTSTTTLEPERGLATEVLQNLHSSLDGDNESSLSEDLCSLKLASQKQHMLNKLLNGQNPEGSRRSGSNTIGSSDIQGVSRVYMAAATDTGLRKKTMEDRHALATLHCSAGPINDWLGGVSLDSQLAYAAVFDGHGGHMTAAHAARHFHHVVYRKLRKAAYHLGSRSSSSDGSNSSSHSALASMHHMGDNHVLDALYGHFESALRSAFFMLDDEWHEKTSGMPFDGSGSTAVVALVDNHNLVVANAGDSVAVLARGGAPLRLSELHKPDSEEEAARVVAAGGVLYRGRSGSSLRVKQDPATLPVGERYAKQPTLAVTRGLGDFKLKRRAHPIVSAEPACCSLELTPNDSMLLLVSDGVTDVMSDEQMVEVALEALHQASNSAESQQDLAQAAADAVTAKALELGAWDNITAVAILLDWTR